MARSSTMAVLLLAALSVAAFSPATAQRAGIGAGVPLPAPVTVAAGPDAADSPAVATTIVPDNRTVGSQLIIPPGGCMVVSVTAGTDLCLQDASFQVNSNSIASLADYNLTGVDGDAFFSSSNFRRNNAACVAAKASASPGVKGDSSAFISYTSIASWHIDAPCMGLDSYSVGISSWVTQPTVLNVTQVYEQEGCALADAAMSTTGSAADIDNSFVCATSGVDTTNYARAFGATAQEKKLCTAAAREARASIAAGNGTAASGDPCTAARATYIITNPCPTQNTTVNTTARFFLAASDLAPAPAPGALLEPATAPAAAPGLALTPSAALGPGGEVLSPATAPGTAEAPAPGAPGSGTASDPTPSAMAPGPSAMAPGQSDTPAPAPGSAGRIVAASAATVVASLAALTLLA